MGGVYFSIPLVVGYFLMDWAIGKSNSKWGIDAQGNYNPSQIPEPVLDRTRGLETYKDNSRAQVEAVTKGTQTIDSLVYQKVSQRN